MITEFIQNSSLANYAVFGNPIKHSKSPQIHELFAKQTGLKLRYQAIEVPHNKLEIYIDSFSSQGGKGLNITVPFKEIAHSLCKNLTPRAKASGSVNTISFDEGMNICGDTTDGQGLINDLTINHGVKLENKSILILGAGGTVKSILEKLSTQKTDNIVLVNRTLSRAEALAKKFDQRVNVKAYSYDTLRCDSFDIIINGTSLSLSNKLPLISKNNINKKTFCYDLMYSSDETAFMKWAIDNGASKAVDGLGMLVEQAAESFRIWHDVKPDTSSVIKTLKDL